VQDLAGGEHPIFSREAPKRNIFGVLLRASSFADVPRRNEALISSGWLLGVGCKRCHFKYWGMSQRGYPAELACEIEINRLKKSIGLKARSVAIYSETSSLYV